MNLDNKTRLIILSIVDALAIFVIGLEAGRFAFGNRGVSLSSPVSETSSAAPAQASNAPDALEAPSQSASNAPTEPDPLAACIASVKATAAKAGTDYEKGDILVSFPGTASYAEAMAVLDSNGLKLHNSASSQKDYAANHWLTVNVPQGDEFKEVCVLRGESGVKYAGLNYTFKLAQ